MTTQVQPVDIVGTCVVFEKPEFSRLRVINRDGEPWFVLRDLCNQLDLTNPSDAASALDEEDKGIAKTATLGGEQSVIVVNESGFYSLAFSSRKPEAKRFKKWVTSVVLPSIRKTGAYVGRRHEPDPPLTATFVPGRETIMGKSQRYTRDRHHEIDNSPNAQDRHILARARYLLTTGKVKYKD